jgi:hypothetical protein
MMLKTSLRFVSECYCHSLMEGEVIQESKNGHFKLETLAII